MRWLALVLLAACARAPVMPEVAQVIVFRDTVSVVKSDGALCVVKRPGGALVWDGVLTGCAYALPVAVRLVEPVPVRRELRRGAGAVVVVDGLGWG